MKARNEWLQQNWKRIEVELYLVHFFSPLLALSLSLIRLLYGDAYEYCFNEYRHCKENFEHRKNIHFVWMSGTSKEPLHSALARHSTLCEYFETSEDVLRTAHPIVDVVPNLHLNRGRGMVEQFYF